MSNDINDKKNEKKSFWESVPGILTAIAALITACGGIIVAIGTLPRPNIFFPSTEIAPTIFPSATPYFPPITETPTVSNSTYHIIFQESFTNNNNNWTTLNGEDTSHHISVENGTLHLDVSSSLNGVRLFFSDNAPIEKNVDIELESRHLTGDSIQNGLFLRLNSDGYYIFQISSQNKSYSLNRWSSEPAGWSSIVDWTYSPYIKNDTNLLRIVANENSFTIYINGQIVEENVSDKNVPLGAGQAGIAIGLIDNQTSSYEYDNFKISTDSP